MGPKVPGRATRDHGREQLGTGEKNDVAGAVIRGQTGCEGL